MIADVHTHFIPPSFVAAVRGGHAPDHVITERRDATEWIVHPQGYRYPLSAEFFELEAKLQQMDRLGIDVSILSLSPTLFFYWIDRAAARDFCQEANESLAAFVGQSDRLHGMAAVPLQDPDAATNELRRAVTQLGLRGVEIGTTMQTVPLDDPRFEPFFAAVADLDVPVMLHPYYVGARPQLADFYMTNLTGNPLETCVAASRLILSGFLDRHPTLKIVLVHGGGFMPYQIGRLDHGFRVRSEARASIGSAPSTYLRRFWYDTITHAGTPMRFLIELAGLDRVMLGTDLPFDMADERFGDYFSAIDLNGRDLEMITSANAAGLFGIASMHRPLE